LNSVSIERYLDILFDISEAKSLIVLESNIRHPEIHRFGSKDKKYVGIFAGRIDWSQSILLYTDGHGYGFV